MAQDYTGSPCPGRKDVHPLRCTRYSHCYGQQLELCTTHFEEREADRKAHRDRVSERSKEEAKARRRDMFLSAIQESPSRISKRRLKDCECIVCGQVTPAGSRSFNVELVAGSKAIKAAHPKIIGSRTVRACEECAGAGETP